MIFQISSFSAILKIEINVVLFFCYRKRLEEQEASNEEYMVWREGVLQSDFEDRLKNSDSTLVEELQTEVEELREKCDKLNEKVQQKKAKINQLQTEKESLAINLKHAESELHNCKQLLEAKESESDSKYIDELRSQMETAEERAKVCINLIFHFFNETKMNNFVKQ